MALSSTQQTANTVLNKETDVRFWVSTGYKPLQKLDMSIPTDHAMAPVWDQVHQQVVAEDAAGKLRLTYTDVAVQAKLAAAAAASHAAGSNLDAAATATDPAVQDHHLVAAADAHAAATQHVLDAQEHAQVTPPDPQIVQQASANATAVPPPPHAVGDHHVALEQARKAPGTVSVASQNALQPRRRMPAPAIHPLELATARREAPIAAQRAIADGRADFVGIMRVPGEVGARVFPFASRAALVTWYNALAADARAHGCYIAAFDRRDPAWPQPIADGLGAEIAIIVTAQPPDAGAPTPDAGPAPGPSSPAPAPTPAPLPDTPQLTVTPPSTGIVAGHGKAILIGLGALAVVGGGLYLASKSSKRMSSSPRSFGTGPSGTMRIRG